MADKKKPDRADVLRVGIDAALAADDVRQGGGSQQAASLLDAIAQASADDAKAAD